MSDYRGPPMPEPDRKRGGRAGAIAVLVIGLLILIPSGLCTGIFTIYTIMMAFNTSHHGSAADFFGLVLTFGGPFVLIGGLLTWLGVRMLRRR